MNLYPRGQCTWWCADQEPWCERYGNLSNAKDWAGAWREHGGFVGMTPADGCVACFQPGSNEADAVYGHVAVVVAVRGNGMFTVSEMNGPKGPGRVDDRNCINGPGVSYLYENDPTPPEDEMPFLATAGIRPPTEGQDPHGQGAIYLCSGDGMSKRWISGTVQGALPFYEALYGPVKQGYNAFVLDRMIELPAIQQDYVIATGFTVRTTP